MTQFSAIRGVRALRQSYTWAIVLMIVWVVATFSHNTEGQTGSSVQYQTTADWGGGFNGQITVKNNASAGLNDWTLEFDFSRTINTIWDARVVSRVGNHYVIKSAGWNNVIPARGQVSFGFGGSPGNVTEAPRNFKLNGSPIGLPTPTPTPMPTVAPTPTPTATPRPSPTPLLTIRP